MRLATFLRSLGLGVSTVLLIVGLASIMPSYATQKAVLLNSTLPLITPASTPLQLTQEGRIRYQEGQFAEARTLWQKASASFEAANDPLN